jgi:accessory colonization factor AcfC
MHPKMGKSSVKAVCAALFVALTVFSANAQNAPLPAKDEAALFVLRVYGSGVMVSAMREAARVFGQQKGVIVNINAGPVQTWKNQAIRDGDLVFCDSEYMMNSFVRRDLPAVIDPATIRTLSLHPSSILVRTGNPKGIKGIKGLGKPGIKIMVVAGPDEPGMWEDAARSAGGDKLVDDIRRNIVLYAVSSAEAKSLWSSDPSCDAWPVLTSGQQKSPQVITAQEDALYRSCVIALTNRSMQKALAEEFADFIVSAEGQAIFFKWTGQAP